MLAFALVACATSTAQVTPPPVERGPEFAPLNALHRFLVFEKAQDFQTAYLLLSADLRARYTPERLQSDYLRDAELARDKLARIRAAMEGGAAMVLDGPDRAHLALAQDRAVRMVLESDGWKVASLE